MRLHELRSHPNVNKKVSRGAQLKAIAKQYGINDVFITFTEINKFGTRIFTEYSTPPGIYAYPLWYALQEDADFSIFGEHPYIQVFKNNTPKENTWVLSDPLDRGLTNKILQTLNDTLPNKIDLPSGIKSNFRFWIFIYNMIAGPKFVSYIDLSNEFSSKMRNILVRSDIYAVIDNGEGIISEAESVQAIFFKKEYLTHLDTIVDGHNKNKKIDFKKIKDKSHLAAAIANNKKAYSKYAEFADISKVLKDPHFSYRYAMDVLGGKNWPEGEHTIMKDPWVSYKYALNIHGPWPEAEHIIASDYTVAKKYAKDVLKDPNPETWTERYKKEHNIKD